MPPIPISLQLYTVRDLTAKDMAGTLAAVAKMGFQFVELAGYGNLKSAAEVKRALDSVGLKVSSSHTSLDALEANLPAAIEDARTLGHRHIVVPWLAEARRSTVEGYKQAAASMNRIGAETRRNGIGLAYHNHDFEFKKLDGRNGLDWLFDSCDADLVGAEVDVYWVKSGGEDPVERLAKFGRRATLVHLKDMARDGKYAPLGTGILDFPKILTACAACDTKFLIIEQDVTYDLPPMEAVAVSWNYLKNLAKK